MPLNISIISIMKRQLTGFLLLLTFAINIAAQTSAAAPDAEARLRKHVEYLASEKLAGRRTGEPGATLAAKYIADSFARAGLKPGVRSANGKMTYLQPFPYVTGVELAKTGNSFKAELKRPDGVREPVNGIEARPVGFSPSGKVTNAEVVFVGFGIVATEPKYDSYKTDGQENDVAGKVVMVYDGTPDKDNPHSLLGRYDARTKALIAKQKGAVGMLLISREATLADDKLGRLSYDQTLGEAALPTFVISRNTAQKMLGATEKDFADYETRAAQLKDPSLDAEVYLRDTSPWVSFSVDLVKKQTDANNVVGILEGSDKTLANEAIVIGAHYDHLGLGGQGSLAANSTEVHHGADDNASGTAALIELARAFAAEKKNKRTLIFIAFSGEEEGLLGSKHYVNNAVFPADRTVAMINLDMIGRLDNEKLNVGGIGTAIEFRTMVLGEAINAIGRKPLDLSHARKSATPPKTLTSSSGTFTTISPVTNQSPSFDLRLSEDGFGPSDHSSFYGKKIPVLFFFTGTHSDYHKPSDTAEKINYPGLIRITGLVASIVVSIDEDSKKPTYAVAKSSGMGGARTGFNVSLGTIPSYADATDGMVLDGVRDNSPASKAGLMAGDKIVKLAGKEIRNVMDYTYTLGEMKAGEEYEVEVIRGGERMSFKIIPVKR